MAQLMDCLLCKHEDLSLAPQNPHHKTFKKSGMAMNIWNPSARETGTDSSLASQPHCIDDPWIH